MFFADMVAQCAPDVAPQTMAAIVRVESSHNPYAIGVVGGRLQRQPRTLGEAVATARQLEAQGRNFSMGLAQVNRHNLPKYKTSYEQVFDPCHNLRVGSLILKECYMRAADGTRTPQQALRAAFSCYYSGNFNRGFRPDKAGDISYVDKVLVAAGQPIPRTVIVPAPDTSPVMAQVPAPAATPARPRQQSFDVFEAPIAVTVDGASFVGNVQPADGVAAVNGMLEAVQAPGAPMPADATAQQASQVTRPKAATVAAEGLLVF